jgi:hypothetical protein
MADTVQPIPELGYRELSRTVTIIDRPNVFLRNATVQREELLIGETVDLAKVIRGRRAAPMVRRGGPAAFIENQADTYATVVTPNIAMKKAFEASDLLYTRRPGSVVYGTEAEIQQAARAYIARELGELEDRILNREEWMAAQALTGTITYSVDGQDHFTVTYPKSANQTVALGVGARWNESTGNPYNDIRDAKSVMDVNTSLTPSIAVCSATAAEALLNNAIVLNRLDNRRVESAGGKALTLVENIDQEGALFLGYFGGIPFFQYSRTVDVPDGAGGYTSTPMIRDKYVEFIDLSAAAESWMYYGGIDDMQTIGAGRTVRMKRFSKSWEQEDPSARMLLVKSRPLFVPRKPDYCYSLKVLA